jgi:hypothetical protein
MIEYIKRVSIAIGLLASRVGEKNQKLKSHLEDIGYDILILGQSFRLGDPTASELKLLEKQICLLVDLVDVGRAGNFITTMNAKIFNDSMLAFLKQVEHVLVRKNSIHLPEFKLSELDNQFSRKVGKELSQSKLFHSEDFSVIPNLESHNWFKESFLSKQDERVMSIKKDGTSGVRVTTTYTDENKQGLEKKEEPASSKKIVEEKFLNPEQPSEGTDKEMLGRRQRVLQCLSYGGASIKDIWSQMKDVSEKTVQRDLLGLMREKKVIMLGKKRWAKYYLK